MRKTVNWFLGALLVVLSYGSVSLAFMNEYKVKTNFIEGNGPDITASLSLPVWVEFRGLIYKDSLAFHNTDGNEVDAGRDISFNRGFAYSSEATYFNLNGGKAVFSFYSGVNANYFCSPILIWDDQIYLQMTPFCLPHQIYG